MYSRQKEPVGVKTAKVRSPPRTGNIPKSVPVTASGDTPLSVTKIVHANPHAAGEMESLSNNTNKMSRRKATLLEAAARTDTMEKMQGEMKAAQEKISAQQGKLSSQMEGMIKDMADIQELLQFVRR